MSTYKIHYITDRQLADLKRMVRRYVANTLWFAFSTYPFLVRNHPSGLTDPELQVIMHREILSNYRCLLGMKCKKQTLKQQ